MPTLKQILGFEPRVSPLSTMPFQLVASRKYSDCVDTTLRFGFRAKVLNTEIGDENLRVIGRMNPEEFPQLQQELPRSMPNASIIEVSEETAEQYETHIEAHI